MEKIKTDHISSLFAPVSADELSFSESPVREYRKKKKQFKLGVIFSVLFSLAAASILLSLPFKGFKEK